MKCVIEKYMFRAPSFVFYSVCELFRLLNVMVLKFATKLIALGLIFEGGSFVKNMA